MRVSLVRFNPTVGAVDANADAAAAWCARAAAHEGGDHDDHLVVLPELAVAGYPPRDLIEQEGFVADCVAAVRSLAARLANEGLGGLTVLAGTPWKPARDGAPDGFDPAGPAGVRNSIAVLRGGAVVERYDKRLLPTYDVFDEHRYFTRGDRPVVIGVAGERVGLAVCEDLWKGIDVGPEVTSRERYEAEPDPVDELVRAGARVIVSASASPFVLGKHRRQRDILLRHASVHRTPVLTVNQLGGNDDLVFDGHAIAVAPPDGEAGASVVASAGLFEEGVLALEVGGAGPAVRAIDGPPAAGVRDDEPDERLLFETLALGVRDYVRKTGFSRVLLGVSGGIDSAVTAAIAVRALGPGNVLGVAMPSRYSSEHSVADARDLCDRLGLTFTVAPIAAAHDAMETTLAGVWGDVGADPAEGLTEENVQSRLRGVITMAISNKTGALLLTTGNKSELAVGYCTLYGDMNGGLAVLADVTKVRVYALARFVNRHARDLGFSGPPIPESTITKPPSAELRPGQLDSDSLPPYELLDEVIDRYVAQRQAPARIARELGADPAVVARLVRLTDVNEYKRKQMPIGLKVTGIAFGRGRRRPIAQGYRPPAE